MHYGRTVLEVIAATLILGLILLGPVNFIGTLGPVSSTLIATALSCAVAQVLYQRHRRRIADRELGRKIRGLREASF